MVKLHPDSAESSETVWKTSAATHKFMVQRMGIKAVLYDFRFSVKVEEH